MSRVSDLRAIAVWLVYSILFLSGCGKDKDTDDLALPGGEHPMTFATAMEGSTATGTTTAGTTWKGGEQIAMKVEGSGVKQFAPVAGNLAMLAAVDGDDTFYWQTSAETKRVRAWYVGAEYKSSLPKTWTVERDQSGVGYGKSDFLYAPPTNISFSNRGSTTLRFKHLPAKVVVHLKNGDGLTKKDVQDATVTLVSQATTSGAINAAEGTVKQVSTPGNAEITPNVWVTPKAGYLKSVQALLVPQQMQGKKFIKVTVGTGDAARYYYYTPTAATDANLESGKQYAYEITVTKTELSVEPVTIGGWKDNPISGTDVNKATFRVKLTGGPFPNNSTLTGITQTTGNVYETTGGTSFSISYTTSNRAEVPVFTIAKGMATGAWTELPNDDGITTTYTYTCTNIRSDLWINHLAVGYYYYADGTWSSVYTDGEPACIGIVFWVGDATVKDKTLKKDHPDCTHGLVVALNDVKDGIAAWQSSRSSVQSWLENNRQDVYQSVASGSNSGAPVNNIQGYNNTKAIEEFNAANSGNLIQAVAKAAEYRNATPAPANSSKWYLPSAKELALLCGGDVDNIAGNYVGTANRDLINGKLSSISSGATQIQSAFYWSSTEYSRYSNYAFYVYFVLGTVNYNGKGNAYSVRCVLAF